MEFELEERIGKRLGKRGLKLAVAESCTGGLIGHRLTNVAGSSDYFLGGVMAYANEIKQHLLGVPYQTLVQYGAVSRETVIQMAIGVRRMMAAIPGYERTLGLSVSGIAGPGGATPSKPVGLVWIGLSTPEGDQAWEHHFTGSRVNIKEQAAEQALQHLAEYLKENPLQPVRVVTRSSNDDLPASFTWQGRMYNITDYGRRWNDVKGQHILVMTDDGQTFDLIQTSDSGWLINTSFASNFHI
jgi:nicotinamide-nucleotide amidase